MEHDSKYYDLKWKKIIPHMPHGLDYCFQHREHGYKIAVDTIPENSKVFDYACGLGVIDQMLIKKGCSVSGNDFSPVAVEYCKEQTGGDFRTTGDIFGDGYDVVLAAYFLEHIVDPDKWVENALKHAPRVICHLPRNFSHHGEHIDMGWTSWDDFEKVFSAFDYKRLDIIKGARFNTMNDVELKYPMKIGQFAHPIIEFNKKGESKMHINAREENESKPVLKKVIEKIIKKKKAKKDRKEIVLSEEIEEVTESKE